MAVPRMRRRWRSKGSGINSPRLIT